MSAGPRGPISLNVKTITMAILFLFSKLHFYLSKFFKKGRKESWILGECYKRVKRKILKEYVVCYSILDLK